MQTSTVVEYASTSTEPKSQRLLSLDIFRGLVILAMLIVNNIGDNATTGYFWKHADWVQMGWGQAWKLWFDVVFYPARWREPVEQYQFAINLNRATYYGLDNPQGDAQIILRPWSHLPLFTHCTLADYVMPWFMLIIGVAIPFSVASAISRGMSTRTIWLRVVRRAGMLVLLGWILCYFRDEFAYSFYGKAPWSFTLGMDVLQLLATGYLFARILYELPTKPRAVLALLLLVAHWALLKFYPQGDAPRGTFNQHFDAIGYIYSHWSTQILGPIGINFRGVLSVPPATATMVIGTLVGDVLRRAEVDSRKKVWQLLGWGILMALIGFLWAFDLPFNKPRWTPSYLLYTSGVGTILLAILYQIIDVKHHRRWTYPLVVFGTNAIAVYFLSILFKVLLLNTPRIGGRPVIDMILQILKASLGPWLGGWTFTVLFIAIWWVILDQMYRRKMFWKL
jgi:predicted acyltransferase